MTGRGDGRLFRPSANATVKLGISLTTSSPTLDLSLPSPFYLIVTARILRTPRPESSITLATHYNPFEWLSNRSFHNIVCVSPQTASAKCIKLWPIGWPQYRWNSDDLREVWDFVTVPANGTLEIRHLVDEMKLAEAGLEAGEKYRASFTEKCLGTRWWAFGALDEFDGVKFQAWREGEEEDGPCAEGFDNEKTDDGLIYYMGEAPDNLALVIEQGTAEFNIVETIK